MAIKIKNLEQIANEYASKQYVYKDLSLDLATTKISAPGFKLPTPRGDNTASFDLAAIGNSLTNLFNTLPGQRFLFPEYGLDFRQFLFSPITVENGELIGRKIYNGIKTYESRVNPLQIKVKANEDENQYNITIFLQIPVLNISTETDFILDIKKQQFIQINSNNSSNK